MIFHIMLVFGYLKRYLLSRIIILKKILLTPDILIFLNLNLLHKKLVTVTFEESLGHLVR